MDRYFKIIVCLIIILAGISRLHAADYPFKGMQALLALKVPGNDAIEYPLSLNKLSSLDYEWKAQGKIPLTIFQKVSSEGGSKKRITVCLTAREDVYFNFREWLPTDFRHNDCQFYLPGFWYRRNLRSPKEAPSFRTSDSWVVREDRLSAPLTGIFDETTGEYVTLSRIAQFDKEALTTHTEGDIILSGSTSIGFTGFENLSGTASLSFGFPYREAPKTYIRKLTLSPSVTAFQQLKKGESITLVWELYSSKSRDFSEFIRQTWESSYDTYCPKLVRTEYSPERMKNVISNFFVESLVTNYPLIFNSGAHIRVDNCESVGVAEIGFVGRVLLNAFNAWEYGWQTNRNELKENAKKVFDSYRMNGFTSVGFLKEFVDYRKGYEEPLHSIRRQSEGIYAMLHFLAFEREQGRKHPEWEQRVRKMLDMFLLLQNADGSFPRKFRDDFTIADKSGGSTPSATLPLVIGYKYFNDDRYLISAKRTAAYLEKVLISKSDYFSSTLDANCEDKEASLYAATATYYLALVTQGKERKHYAELTKKATYFALSWYYLWDVPFAPGQMLGDIGLKTRGWGNVSVENNHIDVFVFEFASVLKWLSEEYDESRFSHFADVISTSMRQLLPHEGHLCGVGKKGYYPEVVQHTNWDYGKNGKGYYNDIFAPGWTVASLWELFSPGRTERILTGAESVMTLSGLNTADFQAQIGDKHTELYILKNVNGMEVCITNFGGRIVSVVVPDKNGVWRDVVLGFDSIQDYIKYPSDFGASIGRYANRINQGRMTIEGVTYQLPQNNFGHCLHGGTKGFQYQVYDACQISNKELQLTYVSKDGEEGFPGNLACIVTFLLTDDNAIDIRYRATTDKTTVVNMTNHSYFNLDGDPSQSNSDYLLTLYADYYTPVDATFMTTGEIDQVAGTDMDFRMPAVIGKRINNYAFGQLKNGNGYDHNWILNTKGDITKKCAVLESQKTGIVLNVYTNEPGIQIYTGNFLDGSIKGKKGVIYNQRASVCLETQKYPDTPNKQGWPSALLRPGESYQSECIYRFSIKK